MNIFSRGHAETSNAARKRRIGISFAILAVCWSADANGQQGGGAGAQEEAKSGTRLNEIVVTATRRSENIMDVPLSIRAFGSEEIAAMGADDLEDILPAVPSVDFAAVLPGLTTLNIRGISAPIGEATVGVYIDEVPITANLGGQPDIKSFDAERVEILRGPQGTLYGEGSMGGTLRIITKKPRADEYQASAEALWRSTKRGGNSYNLNGMVNIPVIRDKLGLRVTGLYRDEDGWVDNTQIGVDNINTEKTKGARVAARLLATDNLTLTSTFLFQETNVGGTFIGDENYNQESSVAEPRDDKYYLYNLTANYQFPWFDALSSTSYWDRKTTRVVATRGTAFIPLVEFLIGQAPVTAIFSDLDIDYNIFTQELRFVSTHEGPFEWTLGAFYNQSDRDTFQQTVADGPTIDPPADLILGDNEIDFKQTAIYGELSYNVLDDLTVTAGLRWFDQSQDRAGGETGLFAGASALIDGRVEISGFTPKFAVSYDLSDDFVLYANAAQGFRAGGVNGVLVTALGAPPTFEEDSLWQYEVGAKTLWFDGRLSLTGALFLIDWSDFQTLGDSVDTSGFSFTVNGGKARSQGFDLEFQARPIRGLDLTGGVSYTEAELKDDTASAPKGTPLPFVSRYKASFAVQYRRPVFEKYNGFVRFDYKYASAREGTIVNAGTPASDANRRQLRNSGYSLGNLRVGIEAGNWQIYAFAENIWDTRISYFHVFSAPDAPSFLNEPQRFGLTFRTQFN